MKCIKTLQKMDKAKTHHHIVLPDGSLGMEHILTAFDAQRPGCLCSDKFVVCLVDDDGNALKSSINYVEHEVYLSDTIHDIQESIRHIAKDETFGLVRGQMFQNTNRERLAYLASYIPEFKHVKDYRKLHSIIMRGYVGMFEEMAAVHRDKFRIQPEYSVRSSKPMTYDAMADEMRLSNLAIKRSMQSKIMRRQEKQRKVELEQALSEHKNLVDSQQIQPMF